ncbi:MAG TPA: Flp family type IVb pilin [Candidatus Elarobacter sp.]|jgi:Flp pilus assembly pilin Flp|nr:Flp family type IVb pilin [Candidatus Elarobacter sp.]
MTTFVAMLRDEDAASLTEYALVLALIAVVAIVGLNQVYNAVSATLNNVGDKLTAAQSGP